MSFDVVIIGAGAAGINAALVLGRARRSVLVCDDNRPRNGAAPEMHGFISRDHSSPSELLAIGRTELDRYPNVTFLPGKVTAVDRQDDRFIVTLLSGDSHRSKRLLLATGMSDVLPDVAGLATSWGRSVYVCPYCDGWEVQDRYLAVYGGIGDGVALAQELYQWSHKIVVIGPTSELLSEEQRRWLEVAGVRIVTSALERVFENDGQLSSIELRDGQRISCDALFLSTALREHSDLVKRLGCKLLENTTIEVDADSQTTLRGCYAAGDAVTHYHQVIIAAASGVRAAISINNDLTQDDVSAMVHGKT